MAEKVKVKVKFTNAVEKAVERSAPETLQQAGNYTMRVARAIVPQTSNPNKAARPGRPVHSHKGFRKTIVYGLANDKRSVLVGPQLVRSGLSNIAKAHEFGGMRKFRDVDPELKANIKIGSLSPVNQRHVNSHDSIVRRDARKDPLNGQNVVWIRIRTKAQMSHSKRLSGRMMKKYSKQRVRSYPARPYMRPALELSLPKLSKFWVNSVRP